MKWIRLLKPVGDHKAGEFLSVDESTARAYVDAQLAEDGGNGPEHHLMREAMAEFQTSMAGIVRETAATIQRATRSIPRPGVIEPGLSQVDKTRGVTDYLRKVVSAMAHPDVEERSKAHTALVRSWDEGGYGVTRGATEGQGAAGGYTTPVIYETQVFQVAAENEVVASKAKAVPLTNRTVEWPALDQYSAPATGQSAFFGGVAVYRKGEVTQRTATQASWAKIQLNANDLTAYTEMSRDLLMDSTIAFDGYVTGLIGQAIGWREDWEAINGLGSGGQFLGYLNAPATISVSRNTGSTIKYVDLVTMYSKMMAQCKGNAFWVVHPYTMATLLQIVDGSNRYIFQPYINPAGDSTLGAAPKYQMLGLPLYESEKVPVMGSTGDVSLIDPSYYYLGRRSGLEIGVSEHFKFDTDQIAIRAKVRNDGQPALRSAITLADGSNTVSAFVVLN